MTINFNLPLGLLATLMGMVVGLATLLLVWWQAPTQRKNQVMALYLASVTLWGLAGFLLHLAAILGHDPTRLYQLLSLTIALNSLSTFVLVAHFARRDRLRVVRHTIAVGVIFLVIVAPLLFANQIIILRAVTADGLFLYDYTALGLPLLGVLMLYYLAALLMAWRQRRGPARQLLAGVLVQVMAIAVGLIPQLGAYAIDTLGSAVASLLFARLILQEQLFGPLVRLNADLAASNTQLAASNARLITVSQELQATADELRRARDAAEAASRAKTTFLATMSHELRTPLTAILGYSELIQFDLGQLGQPALVEDLDRIRRAGTHLLTLINSVLDLSKIEAGKIELHAAAIDIQALLHDLETIVAPLAQRQGNRLAIERETALASIEADGTRLQQVLLNILGNACKFTRNGTITLVVADAYRHSNARPACLAPDAPYVLFEVRDTGIGISGEQQGRLFEAFTQVTLPSEYKQNGTGLGLAISRQLCRLMGGEITLQSAPGQGTTVDVWLPASQRSAAAGQESNASQISDAFHQAAEISGSAQGIARAADSRVASAGFGMVGVPGQDSRFGWATPAQDAAYPCSGS